MNMQTELGQEANNIMFQKVILKVLADSWIERAHERTMWTMVKAHEADIRTYLRVLNYEFTIDEELGFAYITGIEGDDGKLLPSLTKRENLTYITSLLLVLLRKYLMDHALTTDKPSISRDEIYMMINTFFNKKHDEIKQLKEFDRAINKVVELKLLRSSKNDPNVFEIVRILERFVDAQWLGDFNQKLESYKLQITSPDVEEGDETDGRV